MISHYPDMNMVYTICFILFTIL